MTSKYLSGPVLSMFSQPCIVNALIMTSVVKLHFIVYQFSVPDKKKEYNALFASQAALISLLRTVERSLRMKLKCIY